MNGKSPLKIERERRGWSQQTVAEAVGTDPTTVGRWERGVSLPYPFFREKLCVLFEKNAYELGLVQHAPDEARPLVETTFRDPSIPQSSLKKEECVGRGGLLRQLQQDLIRNVRSTSIALYGLPGVGKTTLALQLAFNEDIISHFHDGILWAGLGIKSNVLGHLSRWARFLGVVLPDVATQDATDSLAMALRSWIGSRRLLLILDDVWNVEEALTLMVGGAECSYVLTTRFPQIAHQVVMDSENVHFVQELNEQEGVELLSRWTSPTLKEDVQKAQDIVRLVGGLPLALTLIGKYLRTQTYNAQIRRMQAAFEQIRDTHVRLQLAEVQAPLERHPSLAQDTRLSLESVIAVSDQQLDDQAQVALRALSVFPPKPESFSEEMALAVSALPVEVLDTLSDAGLLESVGLNRYTMHQTIMDYARAHTQDSSAVRRLVKCVTTYVPQHEKDYDALELESPVILAALEGAFEQSMSEELIGIVIAFTHFLLVRGLYDITHTHLQRAHQAAATIENCIDVILVLDYLGCIAERRGNFEQAEAYYREGLKLARHCEKSNYIVRLLADLGYMMVLRGNYVEADVYNQEGLTLAYQIHEYEQTVSLLINLGVVAERRGNCKQAESHYQEGLTLARQIDHREHIVTLLLNSGVLAEVFEEDYGKAEAYYQEGLKLAREIEHRGHIGLLLGNLGIIADRQGKREQADAFFREGLREVQEIGHLELYAIILSDRAEMYLRQQKIEEAYTDFQAVLTEAPQGSHELYAYAWYGLAKISYNKGNIVEARQLATKSVETFEAIHHRLAEEVKQWLSTLS